MENKPKKENSKVILAFILIGIGSLWLLRKIGFYIEFPTIYWEHIFFPIRDFFHGWGRFIFSWPMILIIVGAILAAGKRSAGIVLIVIGSVFLLPKIIFVPWLTLSFLFPVMLVGIGIALIVKRI